MAQVDNNNDIINLVNITKGIIPKDINNNNRYILINNVALDGFFIGSGKTTTVNSVYSKLLYEMGWQDLGKLGGSNLRLLNTSQHYCLVCDDVLATCSLPSNISLTIPSQKEKFKEKLETFTNHNIQNFLEMRSPNVNQIDKYSMFSAKINTQNILNAAYGQLINSGVNELVNRYIHTFSTDYNNPTNIILLYSRDINYAQIQFTLASVIDANRHVKSMVPSLLNEINKTIIDKPFNYGDRRNHLIVYYDECHAFYTRGLANRKDYAKLCYKNIHARNRQFETSYFNSFDVFHSFFNFHQEKDETIETILKMIYNLRNDRDEYINCWSHDEEKESGELIRNSLSFNETVEKIVQKIVNEICLLCRKK